MNAAKARDLLRIYRPGIDDAADPRFAEALALARRDPELAAWLAREQATDAALRVKLQAVPVPPGLKAELLALDRVVTPVPDRWRQLWRPALAGAATAAVITLLATLALLRPAAPSPSTPRAVRETPAPPPSGVEPKALDHIREEMISFVQLTPSLAYESHDVDKLRDYLERQQGPAGVQVPAGLAELPGKGCRALSFRGRPVALICFSRKNGQLVHLLAVDQSVVAPSAGTRENPVVQVEGAWTTATWMKDGLVYMIAVKGEESLLDSYLKTA